jgi:hypothetical protein
MGVFPFSEPQLGQSFQPDTAGIQPAERAADSILAETTIPHTGLAINRLSIALSIY